jgi:transmembrane sensor
MTDHAPRPIDWTDVARYAAGDGTPAERSEIERFMAAEPGRRAGLDAIAELAGQTRPAMSPDERAEVFAALAPRLRQTRARFMGQPRWHSLVKIAAAVLLAVGVSVAGYVMVRVPGMSTAPGATTYRAVTTARGQRLLLRLPDSTRVFLAPASTLRYASNYGARARSVELVGEAAFTVVHDERRPFIVRAGRLVARDLGTEFVVRAFPDDRRPEVVVREGTVAIGGAVVRPGQVGYLTAADAPMVESADTAVAFAWTKGDLVFRRSTLADAVRQLERWFDVELAFGTPDLARLNITGSFRTDLSAVDMLDALTAVLHLKVVRDGPKRYTLTRRTQ